LVQSLGDLLTTVTEDLKIRGYREYAAKLEDFQRAQQSQ
jgi:hypothetical protein